MAELPGDDADVDALGAELGGVGVPQAVGVHAPGDAGEVGQVFFDEAARSRASSGEPYPPDGGPLSQDRIAEQ